jgi:lysyl-tRNA synthetase class II
MDAKLDLDVGMVEACRLLMILAGVESIREVVSLPTLRERH